VRGRWGRPHTGVGNVTYGAGRLGGQIPDKRGQVPDIAVTGYGVQWIVWSEAYPKRPLAAAVVSIGGHTPRSRRVLVP
jgi:hypothetical protein